MKQKNIKKAGFSLIEVLFSILFLTIIVFGVLKLQTSNLVLANAQQNELKAHLYAGQALEIAQTIGFEAFQACNAGCHLTKNGEKYGLQMGGVESLDNKLFDRSFEVKETLDFGILLLSKVIWTDSTGNHEISAKRIIF